MNIDMLFLILAVLAAIFAVAAFGRRLRAFNALPRPKDRATPKGSVSSGVAYAYTLGMLPWAKESTRRHWIAYLRGVGFHVMIFLSLALLIVSPWFTQLPIGLRTFLALFTALGAIFGLAGLVMRFVEHNLKALSTLDDIFAVALVSLFMFTATIALLNTTWTWLFWLVSSVMLVYMPLGKIRHCIYYAYSRLFFGKAIGSRGVLPHSQQAR